MARIEACGDHENCTVIAEGVWPERGSWRSHLSSEVPVEVRLNLDHPTAVREGTAVAWRMPTAAEAAAMGLDAVQHKDLAAAAVARVDDPTHPLAGDAAQIAAAAGLTIAEARARPRG